MCLRSQPRSALLLLGHSLATLVGLLPAAPGACAQNSVVWTTNYYSINGSNLRELRRSINESRPWKGELEADGLTNWRLEWRFSFAPSAGGCRVSSFSTTTRINVTLPRWIGATNAHELLRKTWERYVGALGRHEAGHAQYALTAAAELQKRIKELREQPDCDALKRRIDELGNATIEDYRRREKEYDERTRHGATQGARLP